MGLIRRGFIKGPKLASELSALAETDGVPTAARVAVSFSTIDNLSPGW
jgi:hypothetical protein